MKKLNLAIAVLFSIMAFGNSMNEVHLCISKSGTLLHVEETSSRPDGHTLNLSFVKKRENGNLTSKNSETVEIQLGDYESLGYEQPVAFNKKGFEEFEFSKNEDSTAKAILTYNGLKREYGCILITSF